MKFLTELSRTIQTSFFIGLALFGLMIAVDRLPDEIRSFMPDPSVPVDMNELEKTLALMGPNDVIVIHRDGTIEVKK